MKYKNCEIIAYEDSAFLVIHLESNQSRVTYGLENAYKAVEELENSHQLHIKEISEYNKKHKKIQLD